MNTMNVIEQSFPRFSQLPKELQIKIWRYVCTHGRNVTVYISRRTLRTQNSQSQGSFLNYFCFKSQNPVPSMMQVNHLARETAKEFYKLAFHTSARFPTIATMHRGTEATIWINPQVDTICLLSRDTASQRQVLATQMSDLKVSRIAINDGSWYKENHISLDQWNSFSIVPEDGNLPIWLTGEIKEVVLYSSNKPIDPYGPLNLTTFDYATANISASQNQARHNQIRRFNRIMKELETRQVLQKRSDRLRSSRGQQRIKIDSCPRWLYDICETTVWRRPELKIMMANL